MPPRPSADARPQGPSVDRSALVTYLARYLEIDQVTDYGPNGLQVEGKDRVSKLVTGVSASEALFSRAARAGADAILVHHGLFWEGTPRTLTGIQYRRVAALVHSGMSLLAYHLPLDRHREVGNNWLAAHAFGMVGLESFGSHEGLVLGARGRFSPPLPAVELPTRCRQVYGQEPLVFAHGPDAVETLGIVSGGAAKLLHQAIDDGLDAFLTGEASEWVMNVAREAGVHFVAAGHHATERLGVRALGEHLQQHFGIDVEFIDIPNPV